MLSFPNRKSKIFRRVGGATVTFESYIASLNPTIWFKCDEASGNLVNSGSYGVAGVASGTPVYSVTGAPTGANSIRLDSRGDKFAMTDNASLNVAQFSWIFIIRSFGNTLSDSAADGRVYQWGNSSLLIQNDRAVKWDMDTTAGNVAVTGAANQVGTSFPSDWLGLVLTHDGANMNMFSFGASIPFVTNTVAQTNALDPHGASLYLGNNSSNTRQADVGLGTVVRTASVLTSANAQTIKTLLFG